MTESINEHNWWRRHGPKDPRQWTWTVIGGVLVVIVISAGPWLWNLSTNSETIPQSPRTGNRINGGVAKAPDLDSTTDRHDEGRAIASASPSSQESEDRTFLQREETAGSIIDALESIRYSTDRRDHAANLYEGRWIKDPEWRGTVITLPSKIGTDTWSVAVDEEGSDAVIYAITVLDASSLRPGDRVTVSGKISNISGQWVSVDSATIRRQDD